MGSGIRNTFKFCSIYTPGTQPVFIEGDIFKTIISLKAEKLKTIGSWKEIRKRLGDRLGDRLGNGEWQINDKIIYDGFLETQAYLGPNLTIEYNETYKEAKKSSET